MRIVVLLALPAGLALPATAEPVRMPRNGMPAYAFDALDARIRIVTKP
jgi:hypothetical protein